MRGDMRQSTIDEIQAILDQPSGWRVSIEFKLQDAWIGAFWRRLGNSVDLWICLLPFVPIHILVWWHCSKPTMYKGIRFASLLEAQWACFFDLVGWEWEYKPVVSGAWREPDFMVQFPCGHSECGAFHVLLVEVQPYSVIAEFEGHPGVGYGFGGSSVDDGGHGTIPADASAAFGVDPSVTQWEMCHGAGGGIYEVPTWVQGDADVLWELAGKTVGKP